jgi:pimeloyl-ACP methyl ester carboxylesterase
LLFAGYRVVAYDQPAHGDSDGEMTNLLEIAPTMDLIMEKEGPFHAIIAHSFGTLITSYALVEQKLPAPKRLVYLGAFNRLLDALPRFQFATGLSEEFMEGLSALMYENFEREVLEAIANETLTPRINIPALMFHDVTDYVTPIADSWAIAHAWKQARLVETEGLDHRGALQSQSIHEQVVEFLREEK